MSEGEARPARPRFGSRAAADDDLATGLKPETTSVSAIGRADAQGHALRLAVAPKHDTLSGLRRTISPFSQAVS